MKNNRAPSDTRGTKEKQIAEEKNKTEKRKRSRLRMAVCSLLALAVFVCAGIAGLGTFSNAADTTDNSGGFSLASMVTSFKMFYGDGEIVGGNGTTYTGNVTDGEYANIDKDEDPGYFSEYTGVTFAVYSDDGSLIFYNRAKENIPEAGETFNGKTVIAVYTDFTEETWANEDKVAWAAYEESITSVSFEDSVTPASTAYWFYGLTNCTSIDLTNLDTSQVTSMAHMFDGCSSVSELDVSGFITVNVTEMNYMFSNCTNLESLDVSSWSTANVLYMNDMFYYCTSLTVLDLSLFDTSSVTSMGEMFYNCTSLETVDVSSFDTSNVTLMNKMFANCYELKSLDVSNFDTAKVTTMYQMFYHCESLTSLDCSNFDTGNVTNMNTMFRNCYALVSLDVSNFDTNACTNTGSMFNECESLVTLDVSSFDTTNITNFGGMFANMTSLVTLDLSGFETTNATAMGGMFQNDSNLTTIYAGYDWNIDGLSSTNTGMFSGCTSLVGGNGTVYDTSASGYGGANYANIDGSASRGKGYFTKKTVFAVYCPQDHSLTFYSQASSLPTAGTYYNGKVASYIYTGFDTATYTSENSVPWSAVAGDIKSVYTSDSFFTASTAYWFSKCTSLISADLRKLNTVEVTNMNQMFYQCSSLQSVYVANGWHTESVTTSINMFNTCTAIEGCEGTTYDSDHIDAEYAKIDGGTEDPGYFCSTPAYAVYSEDDNSLTFYNRSTMPSVGSTFMDKTVTAVYTGFGTALYAVGSTEYAPWYEYRTEITSVVFNDTISPASTVGWFFNMTALETVDLRNIDCGNLTNTMYMFYGCTSLTTIYADDNWSTENVTTSTNMFGQCTSLVGGSGTTYDSSHSNGTYARIDRDSDEPGYFTGTNTTFVIYSEDDNSLHFYKRAKETMPEAGETYDGHTVTAVYQFNVESQIITSKPGWCNTYGSQIKTVVIEDKIKPLAMLMWFYGLNNCTSIEGLEKLDTSNVTYMSNMFYGCSSLTSLDLSGWDTSNVENMSYMFYGCSGLTSLDLSGWDTSNVTNMSNMFCGCSGLTSLDLSGWDTSNVTNMSYMFSGCSSLTNLDVSSLNTAKVKSMSNMFYGCSSLTSLDFSSRDTSNVENMSYMFYGCSGLTSLDLSGWDTSNVTNMSNMFCGCSSLTSLDVSNFDTANVKSMVYMFGNCSGLTGLDVSGFNTSAVEVMSYMFYGCSSLTSLDVSSFDTAKVTAMRDMFEGCAKITELDLSRWDTSRVTNMYCMFSGCNGLVDLNISGINTSAVTNMGYMFNGCYNLTDLDVSSFDTANVTVMSGMFAGCQKITELDLSGWDTSSLTDTLRMFLGCHLLETIYAGGDWDSDGNIVYSNDMFIDCYSLVGGQGTTYSAGMLTITAAHIDDRENGNPGYFTSK